MTVVLASVLGVYLTGIFALSLYAGRRVQNEEDYLVAGRRLPLWLAWGTLLATWFGAATVLGAAQTARNEGVRGTILDPFASGGALILAGLFFAKPLWEMRLLTLSDFYARKFGPKSELVASLILVPGYFGWIAAQYIALAGLQETFFGIEPAWGILFAAAIVLLYTMIGGMWSVTLTDTLQMFVVLVTLTILAVSTFSHLGNGSAPAGVERLWNETDSEFLTLLPEAGTAAMLAWTATWASGLLGNIPGQDLMQRVFASRNSRTAVQACLFSGVVYIGFGLLPVGMGLASRLLVPEDAEGRILGILAREFLTPTLASVFVVSLVSVIVSTCTSAVLSPAAILGHNLLGRLEPFRKRSLLTDRFSVLVVTLGGVATAFSGKTILELLEISLSIGVVSLFVPLVMGIRGSPVGEKPALFAMGFGAAVWVVRELLEYVIVPMPEILLETGLSYADYVWSVYPPDSVGRIPAGFIYGFALLPSAISGTAVSVAGYFLGQRLSRNITRN